MKWSQLIKITGQVGLTLQITCTLMSTQVHKYVLPECNMEVLLSRPITYRPPDPPNILIHLQPFVQVVVTAALFVARQPCATIYTAASVMAVVAIWFS